ncbi:hypothetical protein Tco_1128503 [Tanacetum coccineum]
MAYSNPLNTAYRSSDRAADSEFLKLSKTRSLSYLNSLEFNLIFDLEDQFEEEEMEAMTETMEEYMTKTRDGYRSDANEHIEKVLEIVDLFHIPDITQDQIMLRAFLMSLTRAASLWLRNEPSGLIITWEALKKKFLSK